MADNDKQLWFKARRYGWGWTPITWQGWLSMTMYLVTIIFLGFVLVVLPRGSDVATEQLILFLLFTLSASMFLLGICMNKGEKPGWQWGDKPKKADKVEAD